jgi:hypothetical protein
MRQRVLVIAGILCALGGVLPSPARAQERKGVWVGVGVGVGSVGLSGEDAAGGPLQDGRQSGYVAEWGLGWTLNRQLLVGVELRVSAWNLSDPRGTPGASYVAGAIRYYRHPSSNLFLRGSVGVSTGGIDSATVSYSTGHGLGLGAGAGYDFYRGHRFWFSPSVNFWYGRPGDARDGGRTVLNDWSHNVFDVTMAIRFN